MLLSHDISLNYIGCFCLLQCFMLYDFEKGCLLLEFMSHRIDNQLDLCENNVFRKTTFEFSLFVFFICG